MGKIRPGNKQNAGLNGEWGKHVRDIKKTASSVRRAIDKKEIHTRMQGEYECEFCGDMVIPGKEELHAFCD